MDEPIRILTVDDSAFDAQLTRLRIERDKLVCEWRHVDSEDDLRRQMAEFAPDIVLSDYSMPGFGGLECLTVVRELAPETPFVFVSGTIGEEMAVECLRLGATDYVLKDKLQRLSPVVRRALDEAREHRRLREIELVRQRLASILEATSDVVSTHDEAGRVTYLNEAGRRLLGRAEADVPGVAVEQLYAPRAREMMRDEALPAALKNGSWKGESALLSNSGDEIPVSEVIVVHRAADGTPQYYSTIARDIRDRKAYEARIHYLANYSPLTDLPNRALLRDRLTQALLQARHGEHMIVVLVLDLDRFKVLNEGFGRRLGDRVLIEVAARLRACINEGDTVAHLGADEFAVMLTDLSSAGHAYAASQKLIDAVALPLKLDEHELKLSASVGAAVYPTDGSDAETLLRCADACLARVKAQARGQFQFYATGMTEEVQERLKIESGLQVALRDGQLSLYFQPQYEIPSRRLVGAEALMRWFTADGKSVPPSQFIPVAEESGLIQAMGEWALAEACTAAAAWSRSGGPPVRIAVNVSLRQLDNGRFAERIRQVLQSTGLPASLLELEITESTLMANVGATLISLEQLRALGVRISIDDFGTGYSSLSHLSRMPVDVLKVDQSFVRRMCDDRHDASIVQTVISMGHSLGLEVVAEGVETEQQLAVLTAMGCDMAQGFLFARPMPRQQMARLLSHTDPEVERQT